MVDIQHTALQSAETHEPKHITINGVGASGRVITNSSTVSGTSEYRTLTLGDITEVDQFLTYHHADATSTENAYIVSPITGIIQSVWAIIDNPIVGADQIYTFKVSGTNMTPATLTFPLAGSAQGDSDEVVFTNDNIVNPGTSIEIQGNGGNTDAAVSVNFVFTVRRA